MAASWAKNQIAKQLTKFAKNLDPNSLSLKFFKGEGELTNLELDECLLSDILEFPPWLQLTKVTCNRISAKVPWTSLKSDPIRLRLDCVEVQIVATETARKKADNIPLFTNGKTTKYGFSERVIDGMFVSINTVMVSFTSLGFKASVNLSRIIVQSTTPDWQQANSLRQTRIKDEERGEVLTFKEIRWGTMRVDADASYKPESKDIPSTPLRLITNNSVVRLVIKKRISDCSMIASKLAVILDDILWVLTRSQLLKFSSFIQYLIKLRSQFLPISQQSFSTVYNKYEPGLGTGSPGPTSQNDLFASYDLAETSIHLRTHRIDLHLCDDSTLNGNQDSNIRSDLYDESGAALQISLLSIALDHCPYHVAGTKRSVVRIDDQVSYQRKRWAQQLITNFRETEGKSWTNPRKKTSRPPSYVLYESFFVVNCSDFQIMQVTTNGSMENKPFLSSEKEALFLPKDMAAIQVDHTTYYYAQETDVTVPVPEMFVSVNPVQLTFHPLTCVWLNRFAQSVAAGLDWTKEFIVHESGFAEHMNIRVEALMPKVNIPIYEEKSIFHSDERPGSMQLQISQAVISNCRVGAQCSQADILHDMQSFIGSRHYADMSCFPNLPTDYPPLSNSAWLNDYSINYHQLQNLTKRDSGLYERLKSQNNLPRQIWCVWFDQMWVEFMGIEKASQRPVSFLDAFPLRIWLCKPVPYYCGNEALTTAASGTIPDEASARVSVSEQNFRHRSPKHTSLRGSHSESDLFALTDEQEQLNCESTSLLEFNADDYTKYPPPPYTAPMLERIHSTNSLPPAYESMTEDDPGPINKPPFNDEVLDFDTTQSNSNFIGLLVNSSKKIQMQLDHFQLVYLMRVAELFTSVSEKVQLDNARCEEERRQSDSDQAEQVVMNVSIPEVLLDIVLPPCVGIDPVQRLNLSDRIKYETERSETSVKSISPTASLRLPLRRASKDYANFTQHTTSADGSLRALNDSNEAVFMTATSSTDLSSISDTSCRVDHVSTESASSSGNNLYLENESTQDAQVQVGESVISAKLDPSLEEQLVSVLRVRVGSLTVGIQSTEDEQLVKVASTTLEINELGNMKYSKILDPRGHLIRDKSRDKQPVDMDAVTGDGPLKMRLTSCKSNGDFADIRVTSIAAALLMTTVDNLSEFAEDEYILPVMPFSLHVTNSDISLYDDKPRRYHSAIKLPPMHVVLEEIHVSRNGMGGLTIEKKPQPAGNNERQSEMCTDSETIAIHVDALINENMRMVEDMKVANANVNGLHIERESLLKVIDKLQQELMYTNRENDNLQDRMRAMTLRKSKGQFL